MPLLKNKIHFCALRAFVTVRFLFIYTHICICLSILLFKYLFIFAVKTFFIDMKNLRLSARKRGLPEGAVVILAS